MTPTTKPPISRAQEVGFSRSGEKFTLIFQNIMTIYGLLKCKWDADGFIRHYCKENGLQPYEGQPLEKQKKIKQT